MLSVLDDEAARAVLAEAERLGMDAIVEVHDEAELGRALAIGAAIVGINNRDLKTLQTDISTTEELAPLIPADRIPVAESGIRTPEDVRRMAAAGARCVLVGEHLLRQPDVAQAARELVAAL